MDWGRMTDEEILLLLKAMEVNRINSYLNEHTGEIPEDHMKLIFCPECQDVVRLWNGDMQYCKCKKSNGHYTDERNANFGGKAIPLAIAWSPFLDAIKAAQIENKYQTEPTTCKGVDFLAFVILDCSTTIKRK